MRDDGYSPKYRSVTYYPTPPFPVIKHGTRETNFTIQTTQNQAYLINKLSHISLCRSVTNLHFRVSVKFAIYRSVMRGLALLC